jgi:Fe2+ or Zn2+ uptake regulation protein
MNRNFSKQRETILKVIKDAEKHLTTDDIFAAAKKQSPSIGIATIYRNLQLLEEDKQIQKTQLDNGKTYYEPYIGPHHHLVCTKCGKITHVTEPDFKLCVTCIENKNQVKINKISTTIYGECC